MTTTCNVKVVEYKVRERRRLSLVAWDAAFRILGNLCCINPQEVRLLEAWTGGYCGEAMARTSTSDQRGTWITLRFSLSARRISMSGLCSWNVLRVLECL